MGLLNPPESPHALAASEPRWRRRIERGRDQELATVLEDELVHPALLKVCDYCGAVKRCLERCGVVLCVPCWRRRSARAFAEVLMTVQHYRKIVGRVRKPWVRFVGFTIVSRSDLWAMVRELEAAFARLERRKWWRTRTSGCILKIEVTLNMATELWHAHLHTIHFGSYLDHDELVREWEGANRGAGFIVDVRAVDASVAGAVAELAKYAVKPVTGGEDGDDAPRIPLSAWPASKREELAAFLEGDGWRSSYYCGQHRTRTWTVCSAARNRGVYCNGTFRIDRTGRRILRYHGAARRWHNEARAERRAQVLDGTCSKCGKGRLRNPVELTGEDNTVLRVPRGMTLEDLLDLIREHNSTDADVRPAIWRFEEE